MKTGRPKIKDSDKKAEITGVRLREEERKSLEKAAFKDGKTLSAWMRDAAIERATPSDEPVVAFRPKASAPLVQSTLYFEELEPPPAAGHIALWTPREIWVHLNQRYIEIFKEDRRIEFKNHKNPALDDLATYYSAFSNTPDGGILVYGVANNGEIHGCHHFSVTAESVG